MTAMLVPSGQRAASVVHAAHLRLFGLPAIPDLLTVQLVVSPETEAAILAISGNVDEMRRLAECMTTATVGSSRCLGDAELAALARWSPADRRSLRRHFEDGVEQLIRFLDELDGDPDLESDNDDEPVGDSEPCLGANEGVNQAAMWRVGGHEDGEASLGSLGGTAASLDMPQTVWGMGGRSDLEDEHDGREPDVDDESSDPGDYLPPADDRNLWAAREETRRRLGAFLAARTARLAL